MNKKISILVLLTVMVLSTTAFTDANFKDVPADAWYKTHLDYSVNKEIINGYPDGTFKPNKVLTRAEFTKVIVDSLYFVNTNDAKKWYTPYYEKGEDAGLLPASFVSLDKESPITRGEMAVVISRVPNLTLDTTKGKNNIADYASISANQQAAVVKTYQSGIINGYPDGTFKANETLTRAQLAKVAQLVDDRDSAIDIGTPTTSNLDNYLGMTRAEWVSKSVDEKLNAWDGWNYKSRNVSSELNLQSLINHNPYMLQIPDDQTMWDANTWFEQASSYSTNLEYYTTESMGIVSGIAIDTRDGDYAYEKGMLLIERYLNQLTENPYEVTYKSTLTKAQVEEVLSKLREVIEVNKVWKAENAEALEKTFVSNLIGFSSIKWEELEKPYPEEKNSVIKLIKGDYNFYIQPSGNKVVIVILDNKHPDYNEKDYFEDLEFVGDSTKSKFVDFGDEW